MQSFRNLPIDRKLTLIILLTGAGVLLLAGTGMIAVEWVTTRRTLVEDMTVLADQLSRNSAVPLSFRRDEDAEEINEMLSALSADPRILVAAVYDEVHQRFGDYARADEPHDLPERAPPDGQRFVDGSLEVARPIVLDDQRVGTMYLRTDLGRMYGELALHTGILAAILLATILITSAVSPRLRRPIAEPILTLASLARRVAQKKDYAVRAEKRSDDEIGLLTDAFNQMLGEIERTQSSLEEANRSMQAEIDERTAVEERLRRAHDDLAVAKDAAEAASRAKDQFLAVLSHELRTPLTPVLLTASLLQSYEHLPPEVQEHVETIRRHVELEARLIDDLLDLTRITRGKLQLNFDVVDAHVLIRDAVQICCASRTQDLRAELDAAQHHVRADPARLLQIFWNLLNNAVKFTPLGKPIFVRTTNSEDGRSIRIDVIDSGVGIEPEALPRIFNAFEQADSSLRRSFGGLGLGLTIAKALVDAHGGTISVHSEGRERGARFTLELPTVAAPAQAPSRRSAPRLTPAVPRGPLRVLVVEDHEGTLSLMTRLLSSLGHDVNAAPSVRSALEIAGREKIDLVISDLGLPDGNGLDLMRELRDRYGLKGICLSGFGMEQDMARSTEAGFCQHLTKPIDLSRLERAIETAITGNGDPPGSTKSNDQPVGSTE